MRFGGPRGGGEGGYGFQEEGELGVGGGGMDGQTDPAGFGVGVAVFEAIEDGMGTLGVDVQ